MRLYCLVCRHAGLEVEQEPGKPIKVNAKSGWRVLHASYDKAKGRWVFDPSSRGSILVCPECHLPEEPASN